MKLLKWLIGDKKEFRTLFKISLLIRRQSWRCERGISKKNRQSYGKKNKQTKRKENT